MTAKESMEAPPRDYRLLVPRDWFRIDLTQDRWRGQLKTFVDQQAEGKGVPAQTTQEAWAALRNTAEAGLRSGALEFFLRPETGDGFVVPASLLVSLLPRAGAVTPTDVLLLLEEKEEQSSRSGETSLVALTAGEAARIVTPTRMDYYVRMPAAVGYLVLSFSAPMTGMSGPMYRLCASIADSLRWIT